MGCVNCIIFVYLYRCMFFDDFLNKIFLVKKEYKNSLLFTLYPLSSVPQLP